MTTPQPLSIQLEDFTHYHRTCLNCGKNWWGLHCPHDGYQNPCPQCNETPEPLPDKYCDCEFVIPVPEATTLITNLLKDCLPEKYDLGDEVFDGAGDNRVSLGYVITETNDATRDDLIMAERVAHNKAIDQIKKSLNSKLGVRNG